MPDNSSLFILLHPEIDLLSPSASCGDPACLIISQRFDKGGQLGISVITHIKIRKSFPKLVAQLSGGKPSLFVRKFLDDGINGLAHPLEIFVLPGAGAALFAAVSGFFSFCCSSQIFLLLFLLLVAVEKIQIFKLVACGNKRLRRLLLPPYPGPAFRIPGALLPDG